MSAILFGDAKAIANCESWSAAFAVMSVNLWKLYHRLSTASEASSEVEGENKSNPRPEAPIYAVSEPNG